MCGITAYVGQGEAVETLLSGLENLEYRGYDSAGIAIPNGTSLAVRKRSGEVSQLVDSIRAERLDGSVGIGHTRWSTHGPPTDENAHPHTDCTESVAVVHNGIIENYASIREELQAKDHEITSETDTEVVPHLVEDRLAAGHDPESALRSALERIDGSYAIAMVVAGSETIYAARNGSPLVVGIGDEANFLASDVPAFIEYTDEVVFLDDGDVVAIGPDGYHITDSAGTGQTRPVERVDWTAEDAEKGHYDHYMHKEIHEQPQALRQAIEGRFDDSGDVSLDALPAGTFDAIDRVHFVACGTSYHAAMYGVEFLSERGVPATARLASEFVTAEPPTAASTLIVGVTQSGETADTLEALRHAQSQGRRTLAVTNVVGSTAARECDDALFIRAGPEIGVAATKTFSSQISTLGCLAERIAADRAASEPRRGQFQSALVGLPDQVQSVVDAADARVLADRYAGADAYFFIGRGHGHPVALEGALKLKEITYEHAEGFPAGELKHGPLALVTDRTPVFAIDTGQHTEKIASSIREVQSRGGPVVAITTPDSEVADIADAVLPIPSTDPSLAGVLANVQLQLFSYYVAAAMDRSIDKPRNLAKSVTVE